MGIYINTTKRPVIVNGRMVTPGQSIEVPEAVMTPVEHLAEPKSEAFNVQTLLSKQARDIEERLPHLTVPQLEQLRTVEAQQATPRDHLLEAINAALLTRVA